jgi:hypothetical protein
MNILNNDTAVARGIRTAIQAAAGFIIGLFTTIWAVPGVPDAIYQYLTGNAVKLAIAVGIPAGVVALVWNLLRKDVKNV